MAKITVTRHTPTTFRVEVKEGTSQTTHEVTASDADLHRYGGESPAERLIELSFQFLLEREPKESILRAFDLPVIQHYFPEFPQEIRKRFG